MAVAWDKSVWHTEGAIQEKNVSRVSMPMKSFDRFFSTEGAG